MALAALLLGCGGPPAPEGTLLLVSERDGQPSTWRVGADGSGLQELPGPPGATFPGEPDPRGTHALLVSSLETAERGHQEQLWLVPLAGGPAVSLSPPAGKVRNPSWGGGGAFVAFESDAMSFRDLFRVERDGTGLTRLTEAEHGSFEPAVAERIAFGTSRDGNAEIYTMAPDGSDVRRLTDHPSDDVHPRWSPDGERLAWLTRREGRFRVWIGDGRGPERALRPLVGEAVDQEMAWSPDGTRLAVVALTSDKEVRIEVIEVATGEVVAVIDGKGPDEHPAWSPDGQWIAFSTARAGAPAIWLATPDGRVQRPLTDGGTDWLPRWVSAGRGP